MESFFWQLPGPSRFVNSVVEELRQGRNVVVRLPKHLPPGLLLAVRDALGDKDSFSWYSVSLTDAVRDAPARVLAQRAIPGLSPTAVVAARDLVASDCFSGKLFWVENIPPSDWPAWQQFLMEYSHACGARSLFDRTLLCVSLVGPVAVNPLVEDMRLACRQWRGVLDSIDMLLYTSQLCADRDLVPVRKRLFVTIVAHLALWDPTIAHRLAMMKLEDLLDPVSVLQQMACERGWTHETLEQCDDKWAHGISDLFDGKETVHSAALLVLGDEVAVRRRIWSAQVSVLLPFVEQQRQKIVTRLSGHLQVPYETRFGEVITDLRDLEIGHIESQIEAISPRVSKRIREIVRKLRAMRNHLAHLDVVSAELLTDDILRGL